MDFSLSTNCITLLGKIEIREDLSPEVKGLLQAHKNYLNKLQVVNESGETPSGIESTYGQIDQLFQEIEKSKPSASELNLALRTVLKMTYPRVRQETLEGYLRLSAFINPALAAKKALEQSNQGKKPGETTNTTIIQGEDGRAKVRIQSNPWGRTVLDLLAAEIEEVWGTEGVPRMISKEGLYLSQYIDGDSLTTLFKEDPKGAEKVHQLELFPTQMLLLTGLLRGRGDGNLGNSMINREGTAVFDVDEEESLLKANREFTIDAPDVQTNIGYLATMCFPQARVPCSSLLRTLFLLPEFERRFITQLRRRIKTSPTEKQKSDTPSSIELNRRIDALKDRFRILREELGKNPEATPEELFFAIYGRHSLYKRILREGYTRLDYFGIFAQLPRDDTPSKELAEMNWIPLFRTPTFIENGKRLDDPFQDSSN